MRKLRGQAVTVTMNGRALPMEVDSFETVQTENGKTAELSLKIPEPIQLVIEQRIPITKGTHIAPEGAEAFYEAITRAHNEYREAEEAIREAASVLFMGDGGLWCARPQGGHGHACMEASWLVDEMAGSKRRAHFLATRPCAILIARGLAKKTMTMTEAKAKASTTFVLGEFV